ncbi:MAG: helix-turn-helix domain-containing protein [Bacteroidota bacterium]
MAILFLLASLGVVNGILVSIYLVVKKPRSAPDIYFSGLVAALSIRIGKSIFFYFSDEADLLILQIGLSACIFIGPFFYLYLKSLRKSEMGFARNDILLLVTLLVAIVWVGLVYPYRSFPEIWNGYIIYGIYGVWLVFLLLGLYHYYQMRNGLMLASEPKDGDQRYLTAIVVAMIFITLTYLTALFVGFTYIWGALIFSFTFYYLLARLFFTKKHPIPKTSDEPLENAAELLQQVNQLMAERKLFTQRRLKLDELAAQVDMSKHTLSRVLNEAYQHGFAQYINEYRVREAKQLIASRPELSLEGIGYEAGFNSKSAFFDTFKKLAHCTPAEYKQSREEVI